MVRGKKDGQDRMIGNVVLFSSCGLRVGRRLSVADLSAELDVDQPAAAAGPVQHLRGQLWSLQRSRLFRQTVERRLYPPKCRILSPNH